MVNQDLMYRLKMQGRGDVVRYLNYWPHQSVLRWEDNLELVDLASTGHQYTSVVKSWSHAHPVTPTNPGKKVKGIHSLKIQLGLKCNFSCSYCSQRSEEGKSFQGTTKDAEEFVKTLPNWFDGGKTGDGQGVRVEFWGGEPLVYWKNLKFLGEELRKMYPQLQYNIVTNGTLLNDEMIEWLDKMDFGVGISHDGPQYGTVRGKDPLDDELRLANIRKLFLRLSPKGKVGFNCVITRQNYSLVTIRNYIAMKLGVSPQMISLTTEEILLPYDEGGMQLSPQNESEHNNILQNLFWEASSGLSTGLLPVRRKIDQFFKSLADQKPSYSVGQKCGMDRPEHIAVDLKGNVMTCQNTGAAGKHFIGTTQKLDEVRLSTAHHWSTRKECVQCPVVQLCEGACLFLENKYWEQACDNSFTYNLSVLASAMFWLTKLILVEIEGPVLRRESLPTKIKVINIKPEWETMVPVVAQLQPQTVSKSMEPNHV